MTRDGVLAVPKLSAVELGSPADRLSVRMIVGQSLADWEAQTAELASSFGVRSARVYSRAPGSLCVELMHGDALAEVVTPSQVLEDPDLSAVRIGVREDGEPWTVPLLGGHLLIGAETGAGKSSIIQAVLHGIAVPISRGLVSVWGIDPKGGMELGFAGPMCARFTGGPNEDIVTLLEDAVRVMDARARRLAGVTRRLRPTLEEPLIVVLVDELSSLTAYERDAKLRARADAAISALLARGRAVGVCVIGAAQDVRKEVFSGRSLFSQRIALRLKTPIEVDMVLGEGMHKMGAAADRIPSSTPGVGYVVVEGVREPMRVRAAWLDDDAIRAMAARYPAPRVDEDSGRGVDGAGVGGAGSAA